MHPYVFEDKKSKAHTCVDECRLDTLEDIKIHRIRGEDMSS